MKNINRLLLTLLMATSTMTFAAGNIATVNGIGISQSLFNQEVQNAVKSGAKDTSELREAIKNQMIANELLYQEAQKQRLDKNPDIIRIVEATKRQAMMDLYITKSIKPQPITDNAVKEEYDNYKSRLGAQEYHLRLIQTSSDAAAQAALKQIKGGQDFASVAQKTSIGPTAQQGGLTRWISFKTPAQEGKTDGLPLPVAQAIEKMRIGDISSVIHANGIWWIVKLEESRVTKILSFDELKQEIRQALNARAFDAAVGAKLNALYRQAKIQ